MTITLTREQVESGDFEDLADFFIDCGEARFGTTHTPEERESLRAELLAGMNLIMNDPDLETKAKTYGEWLRERKP